MLTLYFSGTGNTKYLAEIFSKKMDCECYSIEEDIDFDELIENTNTIAFGYPIYGSCVPPIMQNFVRLHLKEIQNKQLILFCTQYMFSGDGARVFTDLLGKVPHEVIYAQHFNMPNNIPNFFLFPIKNGEALSGKRKRIQRKLSKMVAEIKNGKKRKKGFNPLSEFLGYRLQRDSFEKILKKHEDPVKISETCILCGICVKKCPTKNLERLGKQVVSRNKCTLCYRCVNSCPQKAITVFTHGEVKNQYRGID